MSCVTRAQAYAAAHDKPDNFLHVCKPEIDCPGVDEYDAAVYAKGAENLRSFIARGVLTRDPKPCYYVYTQQRPGGPYDAKLIKTHENTRAKKEAGRVALVDAQGANAGPVFLAYRTHEPLTKVLEKVTAKPPYIDFVAPEDKVVHRLWRIDAADDMAAVETGFRGVPALHSIASQAGSLVAAARRKRRGDNDKGPSAHDTDYFLAVCFPHHELKIMEYNRVLKSLDGLTGPAFVERLRAAGFTVTAVDEAEKARPATQDAFGLALRREKGGIDWFAVKFPPAEGDEATDVVKMLGVSRLTERILFPFLGITAETIKSDERVDFVGGVSGAAGLEAKLRADCVAAFWMAPMTMDALLAIADNDRLVPPKATWFEPKLRSGVVVRVYDEE